MRLISCCRCCCCSLCLVRRWWHTQQQLKMKMIAQTSQNPGGREEQSRLSQGLFSHLNVVSAIPTIYSITQRIHEYPHDKLCSSSILVFFDPNCSCNPKWMPGGQTIHRRPNEQMVTYTRARSNSCSTETLHSSVPTHTCSFGCLHLHSVTGSVGKWIM